MTKLNAEQQRTIEGSIWIVHTALKKQGLDLSPQTEDLRQSAILYMCQVLQRFDPTKNIKWTTFAYKNVYLYIKRLNHLDKKRQSHIVNEEYICLAEPSIEPLNEYDNKSLIDGLKSLCTAQECQILDLKLQGYKGTEISKIIHCSTSKVNKCLQSIKSRAKEYKN